MNAKDQMILHLSKLLPQLGIRTAEITQTLYASTRIEWPEMGVWAEIGGVRGNRVSFSSGDVVTLAKADQPSGVATGLLLLGRSAQQTNIVPIA